jgi:uncharacterized membrane protein YjjB (DUF3815 family)
MSNTVRRVGAALLFAVGFYLLMGVEVQSKLVGGLIDVLALVLAYLAGVIGAGVQGKLAPTKDTGKMTG